MLLACFERSYSQQTLQQWQQTPQQRWLWLLAWLLVVVMPVQLLLLLQQLRQQQQPHCHLHLSSAAYILRRALQQVGAMPAVLHSCTSCWQQLQVAILMQLQPCSGKAAAPSPHQLLHMQQLQWILQCLQQRLQRPRAAKLTLQLWQQL